MSSSPKLTSPSEARPARSRDAQRTRAAILDAAEAAFAQHGFDGARIDAIAKASSYNTSLLFKHYQDKLGLYLAVLQRADQELNALLESVLTPWLPSEVSALEARAFQDFLEALVRTTFDYMLAHTQFMRILTWEMAAGWKTYRQLASQFAAGDSKRFEAIFHAAYAAGLLRSDFYPVLQLTLVLHVCQTYCASLPLYAMLLPGDDISSVEQLARAREFITDFVVSGLMVRGTLRPD